MAKERLKSSRARLFVALELPEDLRSGIVAWGGRELSDPALRPVGADALHVTLAFLGYRPERDIGRLAEIVGAVKAGAPSLRLDNPLAKPSLARARLFAFPVESADAVALQVELERRLVAEPLYEPEKRAFWPHVTVARVKSEGRGSKRPMQVSRPPGKLPQALLQPASCVRMTLYRSQLKPQGALYTPLAQVELPDDGRQ